MKKIFTLGLSLLFAVLSFAQSQRLVLFEEFTGENCPPCWQVNQYVDSFYSQYNSEVVLIHYLAPIPTPGILSNQVSGVVNGRMNYYGVNSTPWGQEDGFMWDSTLLSSYGNSPISWAVNVTTGNYDPTYLNTEYAVPAPFTISVTDTFTEATDSFYATVQVTASEAFTGNGVLKLQMALVENLSFIDPPGNNSETSWTNAVRSMYPNYNGTAVPGTWTNGQVQTYTFKGKLPSFIRDKSQLRFVAFIQDATKHVQQTGVSNYYTFDLDLATTGVQGTFGNCNATQYTPVVNLSNVGMQTISSCFISEYLDNVFIDSMPWSGSLATGTTTTATLNAVNVTTGIHKLTVMLTNPNNTADPNPGNDSISIMIDIPGTQVSMPLVEGFENGNPTVNDGWAVEAPCHDSTWRVVAHGDASANSYMVNYWDDFNNDFVDPIDNLYAPPLDLTHAAHATVIFSYANQWIDFGSGEYGVDSIDVDVSTDCGQTWTTVYANDIATAPAQSINTVGAFTPTSGQWITDSADISAVANHDNVLLRFRPQNFDGNNFYLDNVNIYKYDSIAWPPLAVQQITNIQSVSVYPNPGNAQVNIAVQLANNTSVSYQLTDVTGNIVVTRPAETTNAGQNLFTINTATLADGTYFVTVMTGSEKVSKLITITHQ